MVLQHPGFVAAGVELLAQAWPCWGSWGKQTLLEADKPGSVKVREPLGEHLPVNFALCCLASPTPFCAAVTAVW